MTPAIQCEYSCKQCGIKRQKVTVPARGEEDVIAWLDSAAMAMSRDHDRRSPLCRITKLDEVWIPYPEGTAKLGGLPPINKDTKP
jgi:hypothetical protein